MKSCMYGIPVVLAENFFRQYYWLKKVFKTTGKVCYDVKSFLKFNLRSQFFFAFVFCTIFPFLARVHTQMMLQRLRLHSDSKAIWKRISDRVYYISIFDYSTMYHSVENFLMTRFYVRILNFNRHKINFTFFTKCLQHQI